MSEQTTKRTRARIRNNATTTGFRVSDELWAVLEPLLPVHVNTHRFGGGRPRVADRRCADGIFFVLRTGGHWEALNQTDLCAKSTAHDRFQEWVVDGVFLRLWQAGVAAFDECRGIDWNWLSLDGAMTKAPLGGEKNRPQSDRPGQSRGQTQPVDGGPRRAAGGRGGRRQSARHEAGARHAGADRGAAPSTDSRATARAGSG